LIRIPGNSEYLSLNVAMAAQIVAYEIFQARGLSGRVQPDPVVPLATPQQMDRLYEHLWQVMQEVDFRDRTRSRTNLSDRIRRFLQRAELDQNEANILRGFLTCVQSRRRKAGG
jgi:tRNA C32,U32 (ribose-2'-O)-methylase TrmJ